MNDNTDENLTVEEQKTFWIRLLAELLEIVLSPVDIEVEPDVNIMTAPLEADILLLRRKTPQWTAAQCARLPDGIRDSKASHILIQYKYTQAFCEEALTQARGYDFFYKHKHAEHLRHADVQTVLLSARKPYSGTLTYLGYQPTVYPGVYRTQYPVIREVLLLSLSELSNEPHNLWIKCFASIEVKKQAIKKLKKLKKLGFDSIVNELKWSSSGLMRLWFRTTPKQVTELGKIFGKGWLADLTVDDIFERYGREEVLSHFKPAELLAGLELVDHS
jgi:hypothetical protein